MSAPARACVSAMARRHSKVSSFKIRPSLTRPQWPCVVYSSMQTSVITMRSGVLSLTSRTARCTIPSGS